jgi:arylformamidase
MRKVWSLARMTWARSKWSRMTWAPMTWAGLTLASLTLGSHAAGAKVLKDLAYGPDKRQRLDVYLPAAAVAKAPVIFMVHGGYWSRGDKNGEGIVRRKVARWLPQGWVFVSTNYRLSPQANPLVQAEDVAHALAFAQANAAAWGADASKFVLMGHSAGAHLVSLLAVKPAIAFDLGAKPWLGTIALDSAAFDVVSILRSTTHPRFFDEVFGSDPGMWEAASPFQQLSAQSTPIFAVCSTQRRDQPCLQAEAFAAKARSLRLRVEVLPQDLSHSKVNNRLGLPGAFTDAVEAFITSLDGSLTFTPQQQ